MGKFQVRLSLIDPGIARCNQVDSPLLLLINKYVAPGSFPDIIIMDLAFFESGIKRPFCFYQGLLKSQQFR